MTSPSPRVAIFGGSFNPPHCGHQQVAVFVLRSQPIDEIWFVPCFSHPFDKPLSSFEHRLAMCSLLAAPLGPCARVDPIEREIGGKSLTWNTVTALQSKYPGVRFSLIVGADVASEIPLWYRAEELQRRVPFIVVPRGGPSGLPDLIIPAVSSTEIREKVAHQQSIADLVPQAVAAFIAQQHLYE